jgi:hypothetical protein
MYTPGLVAAVVDLMGVGDSRLCIRDAIYVGNHTAHLQRECQKALHRKHWIYLAASLFGRESFTSTGKHCTQKNILLKLE